MKNLFTICFALILAISCRVAVAQSCCVKKGSEWKLLAMNADFKASHLAPEPLEYTPEKGSMVQFKTLDGKDGQAFYIPSDEPTSRVLFVFHEWWGVNDYIKREAEKWQRELGNIDIYAIDLYDGQVASDPETASKLASNLDPKRATNIIKGALSKVGVNVQVATLGWCMGGAWSFTASVLAGSQSAACVMYYGFPEKDSTKIAPLRTDVLYIWGSRDKFIKKDMVDDLASQVTGTGHKFEFHAYDAEHAFANPSNPKYNALAATDAEGIALKFIKVRVGL